MIRLLVGALSLIGLVVLAPVGVEGQNQTVRSIAGDKWVITAEAGGVNHVEGDVKVVRFAGKSGRLMKEDSVSVGDRVLTEANGRVEILLNPGSYVRVAGDSAFEFKTTSLEDLQLVLTKGSAIFEVFATKDFSVIVEAPKASIELVESGIYRVDVLADGSSRLEVWKGKAEIAGTIVKSGKFVTTGESSIAAAKFDRDEKDDFELWSRSRAKDLAKANSELRNRDMRTALMRSFLGGGWNTYNSFGLWVYSPRLGRNCFLPFGWGWSSPYGYGFGADIWYYRLPTVVFNPPANVGGYSAGGEPVGGGMRPGRRPSPDREPIEGGPRERRPPFAEVQGGPMTGRKFGGDPGGAEQNGGGFTPGPQMERGVDRGVDRSPVYVPSPKSSPADTPGPGRDSSPAPVRGKDPIN
jgi:hypothetical protein